MGGIYGDAVEPGRQSGFAAEMLQLRWQDEADVLRKVFRGFPDVP